MPAKRVYQIDGEEFESPDGFYNAISTHLIPNARWGRNLDAFNDILRGGFGTPREGFVLRWKNSELFRERLGYAETIRQLEGLFETCLSTSRTDVAARLTRAKAHQGQTVFDWLLEIVRIHTPGGAERKTGLNLSYVEAIP